MNYNTFMSTIQAVSLHPLTKFYRRDDYLLIAFFGGYLATLFSWFGPFSPAPTYNLLFTVAVLLFSCLVSFGSWRLFRMTHSLLATWLIVRRTHTFTTPKLILKYAKNVQREPRVTPIDYALVLILSLLTGLAIYSLTSTFNEFVAYSIIFVPIAACLTPVVQRLRDYRFAINRLLFPAYSPDFL